MTKEFYNLYNNLIKLSRNKNLYQNFIKQDTFSDRLIFFLIHFAFFLREYKNSTDKEYLQKFFDYFFRQIELNLREIGYGDVSINKKMKDYINFFHSIVSEIHFWDKLSNIEKKKILSSFIDDSIEIEHILEYFELFKDELSKKNLISYLNSVSNK